MKYCLAALVAGCELRCTATYHHQPRKLSVDHHLLRSGAENCLSFLAFQFMGYVWLAFSACERV
jgi:hypothetical protein